MRFWGWLIFRKENLEVLLDVVVYVVIWDFRKLNVLYLGERIWVVGW